MTAVSKRQRPGTGDAEPHGDVKEVGNASDCTLPKAPKQDPEQAASELNEIRNLGVGKTAPEVGGEDIDGKTLKLTDFLGKLVVLDFWGDW